MRSQVLVWTGRALLLGYLLASIASVGRQGVELVIDQWDVRTDFEIFYDAAKVIESPERSLLYDPQEYGPSKSVGNFPYPPAVAVLYLPLSVIEEQTTKETHTWLQLAATVIVFLAALAWSRRPFDLLLFGLVIASFSPFYITLANGQPAAFLALIATASLIALSRSKPGLAGGIAGLLVLKPHFLPLVLLMPLWYRCWPASRNLCLVAALVFVVPFIWLGIDALQDYVSLVVDRVRIDDRSAGNDPRLMTNWIGTWTNVLSMTPPPALVLVSSAVTLLVMLRVWTVGTLIEAAFATIAATLIAGPHILPYDWMILLPAALALVCERRSWPLVALLALVHAGLGLHTYLEDVFGPLSTRTYDLTTHLAVPMLLATLLYLAMRPRTKEPSIVDSSVDTGNAVLEMAAV